MRLEINGLHVAGTLVPLFLWAIGLQLWPSLFAFVVCQVGVTYITSVLRVIEQEDDES